MLDGGREKQDSGAHFNFRWCCHRQYLVEKEAKHPYDPLQANHYQFEESC